MFILFGLVNVISVIEKTIYYLLFTDAIQEVTDTTEIYTISN